MVNYKTALLAKEKGYVGPCDYVYIGDIFGNLSLEPYSTEHAFFCFAPTADELINWLLSQHNLDIQVHEYIDIEFGEDPLFVYNYSITDLMGFVEINYDPFFTYTGAQSSAILKALNKI